MSTTDALLEKVNPAAAKKSVAVKATKEGSLLDVVTGKAFQKQMALALPKSLTPERLTRIVMSECRKTPTLLNCSPTSFYGCVLQCAQLGLEPGSALGHCYLLPFGNGKASDGRPNAQLIIGYRGMIDLARRSGQIVSISAHCVHEADEFHYEFGLHEDCRHVPAAMADRGPVTHVYAVARLVGGGFQFDVMSRAEIEAVRSQSKAGTKGPWVTHWAEMAKKTVIRRLFKLLPVSIEAQRDVEVDEKTDRGEAVTASDVIDGIATEKGVGIEILPEEEEPAPAPAPEAPTAAPKEPLPDLNQDEPEVREP